MWTPVGKVSDIEDRKAVVVTVGAKQVAVFNIGGQFHALENLCGHRGGPLADGHCEGVIVTCPWHGWTFDVKTGACLNAPGFDQKKFKTKVENGEIFVSD